MIKDTDDKKIIFDKNKKFNTNNYEIRNQVNNREIQLNDETILHACITDITFDTTKITINFLSKDDLEFTYEISKEAETGEIPDYLQINETDIVQLAIKIYTLEAYKVFMNDTTLPEAAAINELQAQITDLQDTITDLQGTITEKETTITTLNEQLENTIKADEILSFTADFDLSQLTLTPTSIAGPTGQIAVAAIKVSAIYNNADMFYSTSFAGWWEDNVELISFKMLNETYNPTINNNDGAWTFSTQSKEISIIYQVTLSSPYVDIPESGLVPFELIFKNKSNNKLVTIADTYDTATSQFIGE